MAWAVGLSVDDQWPNGASGPRESAAARRFDDVSNARRRCCTIRRKDSLMSGSNSLQRHK